MQPKIDMIGIVTNKFDEMLKFYRDVLDFNVKLQLEKFVEFESPGVRFAISTQQVMADATGQKSYTEKKQGHSFELAFRSNDVDKDYKTVIEKGATAIKPPADMPWGQRTAFFADPDGNIHEIFADLQ